MCVDVSDGILFANGSESSTGRCEPPRWRTSPTVLRSELQPERVMPPSEFLLDAPLRGESGNEPPAVGSAYPPKEEERVSARDLFSATRAIMRVGYMPCDSVVCPGQCVRNRMRESVSEAKRGRTTKAMRHPSVK